MTDSRVGPEQLTGRRTLLVHVVGRRPASRRIFPRLFWLSLIRAIMAVGIVSRLAADHVVNVLPESPHSVHFFDAARFQSMKTRSCYYAIGRGTTTDQPALVDALSSGHLAAAYLDVTNPEPLPPDHELWGLPNCYITPHSSGGHENEPLRLVKHFVQNLRRFEAGNPLVDRVF